MKALISQRFRFGARGVSSLSGVWKVSVTPRRPTGGGPPALARHHVPKRLRFTEVEQCIEVPYQDCCSGRWAVTAGDESTSGAERASLSVTCRGSESDGSDAQGPRTLRFDGLFDGERIAGTISDAGAEGGASEAREVGDFLCTRLFTFWGPPSPKAGETGLSTPGVGSAEPASTARSVGETYTGPEGFRWLEAGLTRSVVDTPKGPKLHPGLRALDMRDWLLVSPATFEKEMRLKRLMFGSSKRRPVVLQASDTSTQAAQREVLQMLADHLPRRYPEYYTRSTTDGGDAILLRVAGYVDSVALDGRGGGSGGGADGAAAPFETAARLVQEDLILMDGSELAAASGAESVAEGDGAAEYRAAAACVCFSFGDLARRITQRHSMSELHATVGDYAQQLHEPAGRAMAGLKVGNPQWRTNWTFSFTDALEPTPDRYLLNLEKRRHNFPEAPETEWDGPEGCIRRLDRRGVGSTMHLQVEYQTLRRLERNPRHALFTVRTFLHPLSRMTQGAAANLAAQIRRAEAMEFAKYKGLEEPRVVQRVLAYLDAIEPPGA